MNAPLIATLALAMLVVASFAFHYAQKQAADELQRSNARVLREFKRIAAMRPHFIGWLLGDE